jgi:hypothetical protein
VPNLQFGKAPGFQLPNCKFGTPERDKHFVKIYKMQDDFQIVLSAEQFEKLFYIRSPVWINNNQDVIQ